MGWAAEPAPASLAVRVTAAGRHGRPGGGGGRGLRLRRVTGTGTVAGQGSGSGCHWQAATVTLRRRSQLEAGLPGLAEHRDGHGGPGRPCYGHGRR
jgi:hypothetical protein